MKPWQRRNADDGWQDDAWGWNADKHDKYEPPVAVVFWKGEGRPDCTSKFTARRGHCAILSGPRFPPREPASPMLFLRKLSLSPFHRCYMQGPTSQIDL